MTSKFRIGSAIGACERRGPSLLAILLSIALCAPLPAAAQIAAPQPIEDRTRAVECLALAVAYEAGHEAIEGQRAVAEVVLNRVRTPAFPKSVCDVVFAGSTRRTGCQFTFTCDGSLRRRLPERMLSAARSVAEDALDGRLPTLVAGATHYHADYVSPYWAPTLTRVVKIGGHIFYRGAGGRTPGMGVGIAAPTVSLPLPAASAPQVFAPWGLVPTAAVVPR